MEVLSIEQLRDILKSGSAEDKQVAVEWWNNLVKEGNKDKFLEENGVKADTIRKYMNNGGYCSDKENKGCYKIKDNNKDSNKKQEDNNKKIKGLSELKDENSKHLLNDKGEIIDSENEGLSLRKQRALRRKVLEMIDISLEKVENEEMYTTSFAMFKDTAGRLDKICKDCKITKQELVSAALESYLDKIKELLKGE